MFRKCFAAKQQRKKRRVDLFVADRARRPYWQYTARLEFGEAEWAALQPFARMYSLEDTLEEDVLELLEEEEADDRWLDINIDSYRY